MAVTFANAVASLRDRLRRMFRTRHLRACYLANLEGSAGPLDRRVRFHIDHLDDYWGRWLGFLPVLPANTTSYLSNDLVVCVVVATEIATRDVHAYCSQHATQPLRDAWDRYVSGLAEVRRGAPNGPEGVNLCAGMFAEVRELHKTLRSQTPVDNTANTA